jgi:hypothetical protein
MSLLFCAVTLAGVQVLQCLPFTEEEAEAVLEEALGLVQMEDWKTGNSPSWDKVSL